MLRKDLKWFFPESIEQMIDLLKNQNYELHAGGTGIIKSAKSSITALIDISKLKELKTLKNENGLIIIGSGVTYCEIVDSDITNSGFKMLKNALYNAASTPLRNRITIGGSIFFFPMWSDLIAPLLALNAKLKIASPFKISEKEFIEKNSFYEVDLESYISVKNKIPKHAIIEVLINNSETLKAQSKRFSQTGFDYAIFNIATALTIKENKIKNSKTYITGVKKLFKRIKKVDEYLTGKELTKELIDNITFDMFEPEFISDFKFSAEYKKKVAFTYLKDILKSLI